MLSIIIPVFNQASYTKNCLEALHRTCGDSSTYEVIVVDNCSSDETPGVVASLKELIPIKYIRNETNLGFTLGSNLGAASATGELLIFLNNDTIPQEGWRKPLEDCLRDPKIGIVGPKLLYPACLSINHAGYVYNPKVGGFYPLYHRYPGNFPAANKQRKFQALLGACLMLSKSLFEKLSGFSEMGLEDIDLCLRAKELGLEVVYVPSAVVHHHGSITQNQSKSGTIPLYSNVQFASKWKAVDLDWDDFKYYTEDKLLLEYPDERQKRSYALLKEALALENQEKAKLLLAQSVESYSGNTDALNEQVILALSHGDVDSALVICKRILEVGKNLAEALMFVALVYEKLNMKIEMEAVADQITQLEWASSDTKIFALEIQQSK